MIILTAGLLIGAGLAVLIYYGLDLGRTRSNSSQVPEGVNLPVSAAIGVAAPDFALRDVDDHVFKLSEMRGKIVVLNFWATWCEPCKLEMPFFEQLHSSGRSDLEIWAVNFDESPEQVTNFIEEFNLSFPILLDPGGEVQNLYRVRGYPTTYLVDENGVIKFHHIGLITETQLGSYIDKMGATE